MKSSSSLTMPMLCFWQVQGHLGGNHFLDPMLQTHQAVTSIPGDKSKLRTVLSWELRASTSLAVHISGEEKARLKRTDVPTATFGQRGLSWALTQALSGQVSRGAEAESVPMKTSCADTMHCPLRKLPPLVSRPQTREQVPSLS